MMNNIKNLKKIKTRIHHKYAKTLNTLNTEKDLKKLIDSKDVISWINKWLPNGILVSHCSNRRHFSNHPD